MLMCVARPQPVFVVIWGGLVYPAILALAAFYCATAAAQLPEPAKEPPTETQPPIEQNIDAKREENSRQLQTARRALQATEGAAGEASTAPPKASRAVELLGQIDLVYGQQKAVAQQSKEFETTRDDLKAKLELLRGEQGDVTPISFLELDRTRDELAAEEGRSLAFETTESTAKQALERAQQIASEKERDRLKAKELLETNRDEGSIGILTQQHTLAEREAKLATETVKLRELQQTAEHLNHEIHTLRVGVLQATIDRHSATALFTKTDLNAKLDEIAYEEDNLRNKVEQAEHDFAAFDETWMEKKHQLDMEPEPSPTLREEVEFVRLERHVQQQRITILGQRLERLARLRSAYMRRFAVITSDPPASDLKVWEAETRSYLEQLGQESRLHNIRIDQLRKEMMSLEAKDQASQDLPLSAVRMIAKQREQLETLSRSYDNNFVSIEATRQVHEKLLREIGVDVEALSAAQRAAIVWQWIVDVWDYPLMSVEDRPITPGKIIIGLLLLLVGFVASRFFSRLLGRRILPRVGMNESASAAMQSLAFYSLVAMVALFSLHLVNVPLTLFTFLGGALAIGVGFGSQNIVNNFISGLILLAERPIRHGDMIQLDGLYGTIESIGARSTRVKTFTNVEIIVPNSSFLENNVVNWTLSDDRIRAGIKIGVAYGSPTREVAKLLKRAADEHGLILAQPEPFVWFTDFGDNSLNFELNFWITMQTLGERMRIESDIRHKVDSLFREAGIVIAYPQRDVHLDMTRPIEVRMLAPAENAAEPPAIRREAA